MSPERVSLRTLAKVAEDQFSSLLRENPILLLDRLRLVLVDGSLGRHPNSMTELTSTKMLIDPGNRRPSQDLTSGVAT